MLRTYFHKASCCRTVFACIVATAANAFVLDAQSLQKTAEDDATKYTTVGNIGLTITNFGTLGNRFLTWPNQPSCEYPKGSRVEHISLAGIWIGAISQKDGLAHVSTAAQDQSASQIKNVNAGFEFTNEIGAGINVRSSLPFDQNFDLNAVSHQDFVMDFTDKNSRIPGGDTVSIPDHTPMGLNVHLESYAWNFPFADFFVILNYTIKNVGTDTLLNMYIGMWDNAIVRNTNLSGRPTGAFNHMGKSFLDTLRMMYTFDFNGGSFGAPANSYIGMKLLGTTPFPLKDSANGQYYSSTTLDSLSELHQNTFYNAWAFQSSTEPTYFFPDNDDKKYQKMKTSLAKPDIEALNYSNGQTTPSGGTGRAPTSFIDLLSVGPFMVLKPGDSVQIAFAVVAAKKFGSAPPSDDYKPGTQLRKNLLYNSGWAQQAYNGEDLNGNNILDPGEEIINDGKITRFTLPQPPRQPRVKAEVENQRAVIYWDRTQAEESFDPISRKFDFEGYRVYRSNAGADIGNQDNFALSMELVGEFDRADDNFGYNTGFGKIKLGSPKVFPDDTTQYWYRYPPADDPVTNLNGWQYLYAVSAYDQGDSAIGLASLECAKVIKRVITGTPPTSNASDEVGVYPNPYYANAAWDQTGERTRKIYFYNLPARSEIKIFTLTGDVVAEIQHDGATYDGSGIKWFNDFAGMGVPAQFAGGEHAWDLITKYDQALATGLYLFTVKDLSNEKVKRGKFVIIK